MVELAAKAIRVPNLTREHQSDTWFCTQPAMHLRRAFSKNFVPGGVASEKFEGYVVLYPVNHATEVSSSGVFFDIFVSVRISSIEKQLITLVRVECS